MYHNPATMRRFNDPLPPGLRQTSSSGVERMQRLRGQIDAEEKEMRGSEAQGGWRHREYSQPNLLSPISYRPTTYSLHKRDRDQGTKLRKTRSKRKNSPTRARNGGRKISSQAITSARLSAFITPSPVQFADFPARISDRAASWEFLNPQSTHSPPSQEELEEETRRRQTRG